MRFCSLGSGSAGNATLVEARSGGTVSRVLIDSGFSLRELAMRLGRAGLAVDDLDAVFVTHEHGDHVGCALTLARRHGVHLWMSRGTWRAVGEPELPSGLLHFARDRQEIAIGALLLSPFTVTHDALEPLQLRLTDGARHLGVVTDLGSITPHVVENLQGCDALLLECNHDRAMLAASGYPQSLKARIGSRLGHLPNDLSAQLLAACFHERLKHLVAAHLSERNNTPALARTALAGACSLTPEEIIVADPSIGFSWLDVQ